MSSHLLRKMSRKTTSTDAAIEEVSRNEAKTQKRSSIDPPAIKDPGTFSIDPPSYQRFVEIAIRKNLEARQIARCQGGVEIA